MTRNNNNNKNKQKNLILFYRFQFFYFTLGLIAFSLSIHHPAHTHTHSFTRLCFDCSLNWSETLLSSNFNFKSITFKLILRNFFFLSSIRFATNKNWTKYIFWMFHFLFQFFFSRSKFKSIAIKNYTTQKRKLDRHTHTHICTQIVFIYNKEIPCSWIKPSKLFAI